MRKIWIWKAGSVLLALAVWQIVAMCVGMEMLLASPVQVLKRLAVIWLESEFWSTVLFSFLRISAGFLCAFAAGILLGYLAGKLPVLEHLLWPYVITVKSVPIASFVILLLLWMNYRQLTILVAFLIAFPVIYGNVLQGVKSIDPKMKEVASVYHIPKGKRLLYIDLPAVKPFLLSASAVAIGMAWKAGVAAEIIGMIDGSIGEMLYMAKVYFQNADLLCWTIVVILLSVLSEKLFMFLLKSVCRGVERK